MAHLKGVKLFTPHDLRRTAAPLAGDLGFDDAAIAKCLDHAVSKKGDVIVADRYRQGLQSLEAHEGKARGAEWRCSRITVGLSISLHQRERLKLN
jgi:integrase